MGGHSTHGAPVNFSGKFYNFVEYGVDKDTERINYYEVRKISVRSISLSLLWQEHQHIQNI